MHKRTTVLLLAVLLLLFTLIVWAGIPKREPNYAGKPLSVWIDNLAPMGWDLEQRRNLGSNSIPVLLIAMQKHDLWNRFQLENLYQEFYQKAPATVRWLLPNPPKDPGLIRSGAAITLIQMGEEAKPAIPKLIEFLRTNPDFRVRVNAANALLGLGRGDRTTTMALVDAMKDGNWQVRGAAADALKQLDPQAAIKAGIK